jgi:RIO kinase 1
MRQRSFQKRARYQEGRKVRGSRQARAMNKSTRFGRKEQEAASRNAEVDALYRLVEAGVRVPKPYGYFNDTLIMEVVTDAAGNPAPRLSDVDLSPETAREYHRFLIQQVVRMLSIGLIHGDLSEFNVLVGSEGPVIIDLPQAVNAAGNNGACAMLERDVNNLRGTLGRFAPELLESEFALEMWAQFEQGDLTADSQLTGIFARDETAADAEGVLLVVEDAREEALRRDKIIELRHRSATLMLSILHARPNLPRRRSYAPKGRTTARVPVVGAGKAKPISLTPTRTVEPSTTRFDRQNAFLGETSRKVLGSFTASSCSSPS